MNKIDPKAVEIPLHFHNYKLLKDKRFLLKGSAIYFVQGPNRAGKTSFLNALAAMQQAEEKTPEPVSRGESEGYNEFVIPGADGVMYTVRHTFDNDKNKFVAVSEDGEKISQVTKIRDIFNYTHFTVNQFFAWSHDAKGRRKQRDIILELLPPDKKLAFMDADDEETVAYEKRTGAARDRDYVSKVMKGTELSDEDKKRLKDVDVVFKDVEEVKKTAITVEKLVNEIHTDESFAERLRKEIAEAELKLADLKAKDKQASKDLEIRRKSLEKLLNGRKIEEIYETANKAGDIYDEITELKSKKSIHETNAKEYIKHNTKWIGLDEKISNARKTKNDIINSSELPLESMSFDDGYLTIDGFKFEESQVCESDGVILVAKIMAKINPAPVQLVGDASVLDLSRLEELNKIAEAEGKIMFVDEVRRDINELQVVGYEQIKDQIEGKKELMDHMDKAAKMTEEELKIDLATGTVDEGHIEEDPDNEPPQEKPESPKTII